MKKININNKQLSRYFIYLLISINLIGGYFMYKFVIYNTVNTFNTSAEDLVSNFSKSNNINSKDFNIIIKNIKEKTKKKNINKNLNNIFK